MPLELYAGSLTRYYAGHWEPAAPQAERATMDALRAEARHAAAAQQEKTTAALVRWREALSKDLAARLDSPLDWDESPDTHYAASPLGWDCYSALLVWAAHAEHPEFSLPDDADEDWSKDRAYQASNALGYKSRYGQLLYGPELWLPCDFAYTFKAASIRGNRLQIGSSVTLLDQLQQLNQATWQADAAALNDWRQAGPAAAQPTRTRMADVRPLREAERPSALDSRARFAFALFAALAAFSVHYLVPLKLDY